MRRRFLLLAPVIAVASCAQPSAPPPAPPLVVFFTADSALLDPNATAAIEKAAATMRATPSAAATVRGFSAPDSGSFAFNKALAEARTQAVVDALVSAGVARNRIRAEGRGPVAFDLMPTESRRVEIVIR